MSEKIKITFVTENRINDANNPLNEISETEAGINSLKEASVSHNTSVLHNMRYDIMSTMLKEGLVSENFCGGRGLCKRCRIQFMGSAPIPTAVERNTFSPEELRQGYRLACMAKPRNDCVVRLDFVESKKIDIVTEALDIKKDESLHERANLSYAPECIDQNNQHKCIIAVDLGTTTIAMQLLEIETGKIIDSYCAMNPQRSYGADVLSRIQAANTGNANIMKESVWKVINDGINHFTDKVEEAHLTICCMCIAGNTTMEHLLMGLSTQSLGQSPFTPVELGLQRCTIPISAADRGTATERAAVGHELSVYITPGISTFVGGDIAAGLYHCKLLDTFIPKQQSAAIPNTAIQDDAVLFIDLGTNGEMAIVNGDRMVVTATAAGPAFEGGASAAVPGSDMIKVVASLLDKGIIDETGLMIEPYFSDGINIDVPNSAANDIIHLTQSDIRALQMAKAAIRAGIDILCSKIENCRITKVYLAGGFGYYLDVNSAIAIGLLPENLKSCTQAVGNTSLAGAFDMGKDLWSGRLTEDELTERLSRIESINLAGEEGFDRLYLSYVNFPKR
ncbi:MAG: ASKHA domain-containing protein [Lachnospiraceae bacterium]|nr:ASKHA domain-containing protein [Lachnospiraceae bacterium]